MRAASFDQRVPEQILTQESQNTLTIWRTIYDYVAAHRQTDAFDIRLKKTLSETLGRCISNATLRRHFKRMADAGLIEAHRIVVRYSDIGKAWLAAGFGYRGEGPPPGSFLRYTLPGTKPSLERSVEPDEAPRLEVQPLRDCLSRFRSHEEGIAYAWSFASAQISPQPTDHHSLFFVEDKSAIIHLFVDPHPRACGDRQPVVCAPSIHFRGSSN